MLATLHIFLLFSFIGVTSLLMLVTIANRLRVQGARQSWRTGKLLGFSLWPGLFLAAVAALTLLGQFFGPVVPAGIYLGYFAGGLIWLVAGTLATTVVVTDYGLVCHVNRPSEMLAWGQVADYFEVAEEPNVHYVFLYQDNQGRRQRLELRVPEPEQASFRRIVREHLDTRLELPIEQGQGKQALEG